MFGTMIALALGSMAEARVHMSAPHLGLRHPAVSFVPLRLPHERNIRSGDHFAWRQGSPRS